MYNLGWGALVWDKGYLGSRVENGARQGGRSEVFPAIEGRRDKGYQGPGRSKDATVGAASPVVEL